MYFPTRRYQRQGAIEADISWTHFMATALASSRSWIIFERFFDKFVHHKKVTLLRPWKTYRGIIDSFHIYFIFRSSRENGSSRTAFCQISRACQLHNADI
jgi:hypothetical protein